jgi:adenylylsulfate kinase-like enzyme/phosphopantetheine adenylyltransferase
MQWNQNLKYFHHPSIEIKPEKILIFGLPGSGKTTLSNELQKHLNIISFNGDELRENVNKDLKFSLEDRFEQTKRMSFLADKVNQSGNHVVCDFVCPLIETRNLFKPTISIWANRKPTRNFTDTTKIWENPKKVDLITDDTFDANVWSKEILDLIESNQIKQSKFDFKAPTVALPGRYQGFHEAHKSIAVEAFNRGLQVIFLVRDTYQTTEKDPIRFEDVAKRMHQFMESYAGKYGILQIPNMTNLFYGRDVGYKIEQINLSPELQAISGTLTRKMENLCENK